MPQVSFVLKEVRSETETLIFLLFRFNGQKLKYSTGQKVNPKLWNLDKQRVKLIRSFREAESINFLLDELESQVGICYRNLILEKIAPSPQLLRIRLNQILQKVNPPSKDLVHFAEKVIESSDKKPGTKRAVKQTIRNLREFTSKTGRSLHFDSIDLEFYDKYLQYAKEQGYSQNTIGSHIKNIKAFMREAVERGLTKNHTFQSKRFKKITEEAQNIYLTGKELKKMGGLDLTGNARLDRVRDLFLVGCYTGLRFSDLTRLTKENLNLDKRFIRITTRKTGETVVIPMNSVVWSIIEKYSCRLPTSISNEKMNDYVKELAQLAEIKEAVLITSTKGGETQTRVYEKWELVTTHSARRSFATNAFLNQVPTLSIMKITGHRTEKSFLQYIKISQEDNAVKLANHPFFE